MALELHHFRMDDATNKQNSTNIKNNWDAFNVKSLLKVHVCYDSRSVSSSSSSYISQPFLCFIFISTVPSCGLLMSA